MKFIVKIFIYAFIVLPTVHNVSAQPIPADQEKLLNGVSRPSAFQYFANHPTINSPSIVTYGYGDKIHFVVYGQNIKEKFKVTEFDKAVDLYNSLISRPCKIHFTLAAAIATEAEDAG